MDSCHSGVALLVYSGKGLVNFTQYTPILVLLSARYYLWLWSEALSYMLEGLSDLRLGIELTKKPVLECTYVFQHLLFFNGPTKHASAPDWCG